MISFFTGKNISDTKKNKYEDIFDGYIKNLYNYNLEKKTFYNITEFRKDIWMNLTGSIYYKYNKYLVTFLLHIINTEYTRMLIFFCKNILYFIKLPLIFYYLRVDSLSKEDIISKIVLTDTLINAYQISLIMNTDINLVVKRIRLIRNIPIINKKTGKKMITRQVRFPMIGSEACPFINHIKKCNMLDTKLKYSIIIIEKKIVLEINQYECDIHKSCVLYKNINGIIKHLYECNFWNDDKYWENKYPQEKEIL